MQFGKREAYHEAGHAVVGYLLGGTVRHVRTLPAWMPEAATTRCTFNVPLTDDERVLFALAGYVAQALSGTFSDEDTTMLYDGRAQIGDMTECARANLDSEKMKALFLECSAMVAKSWDMVDALACAMEGHRRIGEVRLKQILRDAQIKRKVG